MQSGRLHPEMSRKEQCVGPVKPFSMDSNSYTAGKRAVLQGTDGKVVEIIQPLEHQSG